VFVALIIQDATHMRHIAICGLSVPLYNIFPHYLINGMIFEKKNTEHKMCVLIFSKLLSEKFLILRRIKRDMINHVCRSSYKVP
jgi:hypothetical protein